MTTPRASHGTLIDVQLTPGGSWSTIAELGDLQLPELDKNEFDASVQNKGIDFYIMGMLRRGQFPIPMNFIPNDPTHDHLGGLQYIMFQGTFTGYRVRVPAIAGGDAGITWILSGDVKNIKTKAPVDGKLTADVTLRFSGAMTIGGVVIT